MTTRAAPAIFAAAEIRRPDRAGPDDGDPVALGDSTALHRPERHGKRLDERGGVPRDGIGKAMDDRFGRYVQVVRVAAPQARRCCARNVDAVLPADGNPGRRVVTIAQVVPALRAPRACTARQQHLHSDAIAGRQATVVRRVAADRSDLPHELVPRHQGEGIPDVPVEEMQVCCADTHSPYPHGQLIGCGRRHLDSG
jgi:hypothetical protein